jgi:hypothetical protein
MLWSELRCHGRSSDGGAIICAESGGKETRVNNYVSGPRQGHF